MLVVTLNSAIASGFGNTPIVPNCGSLLSTPSSAKLLFVGRCPLTVKAPPPDRAKREVGVSPCGLVLPGPPLPARGSPLLNWRESGPAPPTPALAARATPGVSVASCVKFRPDNGNSVTSRPDTTVPLSLVSLSTRGGAAVMVTSAPTAPVCNVMSRGMVCDVCTVTFSWTAFCKFKFRRYNFHLVDAWLKQRHIVRSVITCGHRACSASSGISKRHLSVLNNSAALIPHRSFHFTFV